MRTPSLNDIDIIIVHYHAAALVEEAVSALEKDARASSVSARVFVVDNGSTEDEQRRLESLDVSYIRSGRDAGYAGGINIGYAQTSANHIVVMNEDVLVMPGCLRALADALDHGAAVAGPLFYWDLDRVFMLPCTEQRTRGNEFIKAVGRKNAAALKRARERWREHVRLHWRAQKPIETLATSGALLAFRRDAWQRVGPWDEGYQMYFDENDWLARVKALGLRCVYVPAAKAVHLHNPKLAGDPDRAQWSSDSFLRFGNRYYGATFMRRLFRLGSREQAIPNWQPLNVSANGATVEIEIPPTTAWPVWIELTPSPLGYPAACTVITDRTTTTWRLPPMRGLPFLTGMYFLTVVDEAGAELGSYSFERRTAPAEEVVTNRRLGTA